MKFAAVFGISVLVCPKRAGPRHGCSVSLGRELGRGGGFHCVAASRDRGTARLVGRGHDGAVGMPGRR